MRLKIIGYIIVLLLLISTMSLLFEVPNSVKGDLTEENAIIIDEGKNPLLRDGYVFYLKDIDESNDVDNVIYYHKIGDYNVVNTSIHGRIFDFEYPYLVTDQSGKIVYYNVETEELKVGPYYTNLIMYSTIANGYITFSSRIDSSTHFYNNETLNNQTYASAISLLNTETGNVEHIGWGFSPRISSDFLYWNFGKYINYYNITTKEGHWYEMKTELYSHVAGSEFYYLGGKFIYEPTGHSEIREYDLESGIDKLIFTNSSVELWSTETALIYNSSAYSYYLYRSLDGSYYECKNLKGGNIGWSWGDLVQETIITRNGGIGSLENPPPSTICVYNLQSGTNQTIANGSGVSADGNYFAFQTNENDVGIDYNEDGDTSDYIIRLVSLDDVEVLKSPYERDWKVGFGEILVLLIILVIVTIIWVWQKKTTP